MFDVDFSEMAVVGLVALLVVGPKDLPKLMRTVGHWSGRARGMARHLRSGFDTMVREAEIEEMNKKWEEHNRDIVESTRIDSWMDPEPASSVSAGAVMEPLAPPSDPEPAPRPAPPAGQLA